MVVIPRNFYPTVIPVVFVVQKALSTPYLSTCSVSGRGHNELILS